MATLAAGNILLSFLQAVRSHPTLHTACASGSCWAVHWDAMSGSTEWDYILESHLHCSNPFAPNMPQQRHLWAAWEFYIYGPSIGHGPPCAYWLDYHMPPEPVGEGIFRSRQAAILFAIWLTHLATVEWLDYEGFVQRAARYMSALFVALCPQQPQLLMRVLRRFLWLLEQRPPEHARRSDSLVVARCVLYNDIMFRASEYAGFPIGWVSGPGYVDAYVSWRRTMFF